MSSLLERAREKSHEYDMDGSPAAESLTIAQLSSLDQTPEMVMAPEEAATLHWEYQVCFRIPSVLSRGIDRVAETLKTKVEDCELAGCP